MYAFAGRNSWYNCGSRVLFLVGNAQYELKRGKKSILAGQYALFASKTKINDF